ncbi:Mycobacterium numidiamassiliense ORFan [Mycobacterium numidiamassiliense]|jgi:hypothetical protein|uniref:Mycobacterium numidiamassiliense ORFan n=1 Tax=Mycobacterium numidiamassiliense TaxID=1841861 RepID=A0A2U3PCI1_9MYCO|nr:Mycobacterium numidiamassiliense ORFan [Mycobacterium numidiamassiliense]
MSLSAALPLMRDNATRAPPDRASTTTTEALPT